MGVDAGQPPQDERERVPDQPPQDERERVPDQPPQDERERVPDQPPQDERERIDAGRPQRDRPDQRRASTSGFVAVLGYVIGGVLLVGYFVWMCSEMASHAINGGSVPISIFGGVLIGVLAGAAGLISRSRNS